MRTWRIEFAVEGETDSSEGAKSQLDTPYSVKVFVRFTIGLLMGVVGFILVSGATPRAMAITCIQRD